MDESSPPERMFKIVFAGDAVNIDLDLKNLPKHQTKTSKQ
jgi:hypothetical protein